MSVLANSNAIETGGYQISRSVRFRSSANGNFTRTPSSATNRRTWTWSAWVKRGLLSSGEQVLFSAGSSYTTQTYFTFYIGSDNKLVTSTGTAEIWRTTQVFRDPSAWYHVVLVVDTTQATADNRTRLYVNGAEVTSFTRGTNLSLNTDYGINYNIIHYIGRDWFQPIYFDGYLTEINFIDGQALTPSSFGQTDPITGSWVAKKYTGSYGTNGFFLTFADNSAATSTTIGKDYSGNGNNFTPVNISVTAGSTYDSMLDVPSGNGYADGGNGRGNYAVMNPLYAYGTLANGNLDYYTTTNYQGGYATMAVSGKIYFEVTCASPTGGGALVGFVKNASIVPSTTNFFTGTGFYGAIFSNTLNYYLNGSSDGLDHGNVTSSMLQFAVDADTGKCWVGSNNTWFDSGSPATGANPAWTISLSSGDLLFPAFCAGNSTYTLNVNFGQRPFSYTPPTGFKALNTTNLPTPTIGATSTTQANKYFDVKLRTGNGSSETVTGIGFAPGLVWPKCRNNVMSHNLYDIVRGAQNALYPNLTDAETVSTNLTAFTSDGYTVGNSLVLNTYTFVDWLWKANGTGVTNTAGTITSTVSANTTSGFSIVTYTGTGANATVGHGLGVAPSMIIVKCRSNSATSWRVAHSGMGTMGSYMAYLELTNAASSTAIWNSTQPTSSVFSVGTDPDVNGSTRTYVAYIFAPINSYSAFGSYTGNGSADGPFVYCGFRPAYILIKSSTDGTTNWLISDNKRLGYNITSNQLKANTSAAEESFASGWHIDFVSNGFKVRNTYANMNGSGATYIYAAFAESPLKFSNAR